MLESLCREPVERLIVTPVLPFLKSRVTAMQLTLCALFSGSFAALMIAAHLPIVACVFLCFSGYLDMLDGALARYTKSSSDLGSVFDIVSDRTVEALVVLGFYLAGYSPLWVLLILVSSYLCVASFLVVAIFSSNQSAKGFHYSRGLIERAEAFLFFLLMILLPSVFVWLAAIYTVLVLYTTAWRLVEFYRANTKRV